MKRWSCLGLEVALLAASAALAFPPSAQAKASTGPSVTLTPNTVAVSGVEWTVRILTPYCGGYTIGRYVLLRFERPFVLPPEVPSAAVSFADGPAVVIRKRNTLQIAPAPGRIWSMLCGTKLPLVIVLSAKAGLKWLLLAEGHLTRNLFGAILRRLVALSVPAG